MRGLTHSAVPPLAGEAGQQGTSLCQNLFSGDGMHFACFDTSLATTYLVEVGTLNPRRNSLGGTGDESVSQIRTGFERKGQSLQEKLVGGGGHGKQTT